jgi:hypothetical protein
MRSFILQNKIFVAIVLYMTVFFIIHQIKPSLIYNDDGSYREFGVGYRHKTVVPIWLVSIIIGILSYLAILYYLAYY